MYIAIPASISKIQYFVNQAYVEYIKEAGFEPVVVTPLNDTLAVAGHCDGLLLPGGIDVDPVFYGEDNFSSLGVDPAKDNFEREMFHAFLNLGKPIFGICRGLQLIAREYLHEFPRAMKWLEYVQHTDNHALTRELDIARNVPTHSVFADKNVLYDEPHPTYQPIFVNSMHHQCLFLHAPVQQPGKAKPKVRFIIENLRVLAYTRYGVPSKKKGYIVEAFDIDGWGDSSIQAVQWHPEELKDVKLLQKFFTLHVADAGE